MPVWLITLHSVQEDIVMAKQTEQIRDGSVSCERSNSYLAIIYLSLREYCGISTIFTMPEANNCLSIVSGCFQILLLNHEIMTCVQDRKE